MRQYMWRAWERDAGIRGAEEEDFGNEARTLRKGVSSMG